MVNTFTRVYACFKSAYCLGCGIVFATPDDANLHCDETKHSIVVITHIEYKELESDKEKGED